MVLLGKGSLILIGKIAKTKPSSIFRYIVIGAIQKVYHRPTTDFCPPLPPLSLFVTVCLEPPPPLVTTQIVTNFLTQN